MSKLEEVFDCRGPVDLVLAGRRMSVVEGKGALTRLTGSETLARIFVPEQCSPRWVQLVQSMPGRRPLASCEWKSRRKGT